MVLYKIAATLRQANPYISVSLFRNTSHFLPSFLASWTFPELQQSLYSTPTRSKKRGLLLEMYERVLYHLRQCDLNSWHIQTISTWTPRAEIYTQHLINSTGNHCALRKPWTNVPWHWISSLHPKNMQSFPK